MLPLITSPETTTVMEWINADEERHRHWREQAERSLARADMSGAIATLSARLCDEITVILEQQDQLSQKFIDTILVRINYYELAVSLLSDVDHSGYFDPQTIAA